MNEKQAIALFVAESISAARSMPMGHARAYLKGLLLVGGEHEALDALRDVYADLCAVDQQLAAMQMQLPLPEAKS